MLCAKFSWIWSTCSEEFFFYISLMCFCNLVIIFIWKRAWPFIWTNMNSLHPRMLHVCAGLVEIGSVVLEKKILNFVNVYFAVLLSSPLKKWRFFSFEWNWNSFTQWCFVSNLVDIGQVDLAKKILKFCQCFFALSLIFTFVMFFHYQQ